MSRRRGGGAARPAPGGTGRATRAVAARGRRLAVALAVAASLLACQRTEAPGPSGAGSSGGPPAFVGGARCAACHRDEAEAFAGSDHARAMGAASDRTVLGDFSGARITDRGVTTTFFRREGRFLVRTEGPDGKLGDFEIAYTFGVDPLQQYLVPFPDGRVQALGIAWDSRPRARGGQRWFLLYPGARHRPRDPLHWTGRDQTWNFQCAECHSTDLRKGYDPASDRYATTWAELSLSCEACHGPGAAHVTWAEGRRGGGRAGREEPAGLLVRLRRGPGAWTVRDPGRGTAEWIGAPRSPAEVEACARCHARRRPIVDPYPYGRPLLDTHVPALLEARLYHADGQIRGEVYEYGSFVQSRMYRAGVTCSDCHEPHGGRVRAPGNAGCAACHLPARFDTPAHHHHRAGSAGARCVSCHMTARTYMGVDPRRDHGFRVPRPDLSAALGTPDACTGCHRDRSARWAADRVAGWSGPGRPVRSHFARALDAGRRGLPEAAPALAALVADRDQPGIARATALALLPGVVTPVVAAAVEVALRDEDPLVRMAAAGAAGGLPPDRRRALVGPLLRDPLRAVRIAAADTLAAGPGPAPGDDWGAAFDGALAERIRAELVSGDRPEAHLNLAALHARRGRPGEAEAALRAALRLDPRFVPALVALADLFRAQGRDPEGERALEEALRAAPDDAEALHALGLLRVRQGRRAEALDLLGRAAAGRLEAPRLAYVYAVALHAAGRPAEAIGVLEAALRRRPADREILAALATYLRRRGDAQAALRYAERLAALAPDDPEARALVDALRRPPGAP